MNEGLKLTGRQIEILRVGIIHTYPYLDDLPRLLRVKMEVRFDAIAKGNTNEIKIFNLIQYFEADGRLKEFIRVIINDRPNSPYLEEVRTEFSRICENPTTPETSNPPKEDRENILYIDLMETEGDSILLKYFQDNRHKSISTKRSLGKLKIKDFDNPSSTAKILYQWLDGSEKILEIDQETILALALPKTLVQYPWELLNLSNKNLIPIRWFKKNKTISTPKDRALGVLFMAAAPTEINSKLNYEQQENKILEATKHHPINLVVEESGWLEELEAILYSHQDDFDILHLSGQINFQNGQACLLTENEFGNCCYSNAEDIAHALRDAFPKIIFLCGQTEYSWEEKALSSLAIELIEKGVEAILTILDIALGNPRLLENLDEKVLYLSDEEAIKQKLTEYETNPDKYKDSVIHPDLYKQIDEPLRKVLSYGLVYHIPVPRTVLQVICEDEDGQEIQRGINLSLIEESSELEESDRLYRVSPILPCILTSIKLPEDGAVLLELDRKAFQQINQLWGNKDNRNEERWREMFRLAFADKENTNSFREQFSKMIDVQNNPQADQAYKKELTQLRDELSLEDLFNDLAIFLKSKDWKQADLETAFIFYQLMVRLGYDDFDELFREVPLEIIEEIDRLWMKYSQGKFGIKGQARIYRELGGTEYFKSEVWVNYASSVGWLSGNNWIEKRSEKSYKVEVENFHLPY